MSHRQELNDSDCDPHDSQKKLIKPPFPPTIDPKDLIKKSRDGDYIKAPNAFIIYRKLFIATAKSEGYSLPMTVISSMSSKSWEQESEMVKNEYKRIAKAAFNYRRELSPQSKQRRKREKWNIVSFERNFSNSSNYKQQQQEKVQFSPEISIENTFSNEESYTIPELTNNNFSPSESLSSPEFDLDNSPDLANELLSFDKYFESQIPNGVQNYQQSEFEFIEQQAHISNIDINSFGLSEFITTDFNNLSFDISNELLNFNSEMCFDYSLIL